MEKIKVTISNLAYSAMRLYYYGLTFPIENLKLHFIYKNKEHSVTIMTPHLRKWDRCILNDNTPFSDDEITSKVVDLSAFWLEVNGSKSVPIDYTKDNEILKVNDLKNAPTIPVKTSGFHLEPSGTIKKTDVEVAEMDDELEDLETRIIEPALENKDLSKIDFTNSDFEVVDDLISLDAEVQALTVDPMLLETDTNVIAYNEFGHTTLIRITDIDDVMLSNKSLIIPAGYYQSLPFDNYQSSMLYAINVLSYVLYRIDYMTTVYVQGGLPRVSKILNKILGEDKWAIKETDGVYTLQVSQNTLLDLVASLVYDRKEDGSISVHELNDNFYHKIAKYISGSSSTSGYNYIAVADYYESLVPGPPRMDGHRGRQIDPLLCGFDLLAFQVGGCYLDASVKAFYSQELDFGDSRYQISSSPLSVMHTYSMLMMGIADSKLGDKSIAKTIKIPLKGHLLADSLFSDLIDYVSDFSEYSNDYVAIIPRRLQAPFHKETQVVYRMERFSRFKYIDKGKEVGDECLVKVRGNSYSHVLYSDGFQLHDSMQYGADVRVYNGVQEDDFFNIDFKRIDDANQTIIVRQLYLSRLPLFPVSDIKYGADAAEKPSLSWLRRTDGVDFDYKTSMSDFHDAHYFGGTQGFLGAIGSSIDGWDLLGFCPNIFLVSISMLGDAIRYNDKKTEIESDGLIQSLFSVGTFQKNGYCPIEKAGPDLVQLVQGFPVRHFQFGLLVEDTNTGNLFRFPTRLKFSTIEDLDLAYFYVDNVKQYEGGGLNG